MHTKILVSSKIIAFFIKNLNIEKIKSDLKSNEVFCNFDEMVWPIKGLSPKSFVR